MDAESAKRAGRCVKTALSKNFVPRRCLRSPDPAETKPKTMSIKIPLRRITSLLALLLALNLAVLAQAKVITDLKPTVILISLDGFRYDYLDLYRPRNLNALAADGVRARWMIPSFPSKTFPNHYTIATGLYPENNGIVENNIYDRESKVVFSMDNRPE